MNAAQKRFRCALYTRKSSEEGLEQSFNSLDAQREACASFVESQRHEGWKALETRYDDGGYSGGSMDRPGLKALLSDIETGKVDVVVVYKVDRLTRSLADFAKIVEQFDARGVSFVSVTQQFNTASSMGRLTLNVLLSFAQFEREVTGERIRDKVAASKKKGMWMGGQVPLGYDLRDRKLCANARESELIRRIYTRYLALGCVRKLAAELREKSVLSKRRTGRSGRQSGGVPYSRGALYSILKNRLYLGEIEHRGQIYPGEHAGIVSRGLWERVQAKLRDNTTAKVTGARAAQPSLLAGLLWDDQGNRLTPSHCTKGGKRYRYYFSQGTIRPGAKIGGIRRVPALELEGLITRRIAAFLQSGKDVLDAAGTPDDSAAVRKALISGARTHAAVLAKAADSEKRALLLAMLSRANVAEDHVEVVIAKHRLRATLLASPSERPAPALQALVSGDSEDFVRLRVEARLIRCGLDVRLVVPPDGKDERPSRVDHALLKAVARGHAWAVRLLSGKAKSQSAIAGELNIDHRYVGRILRCAFLAPDIVESILEGKHPPQLTVARLRMGVPHSWDEQRRLFGASPRT